MNSCKPYLIRALYEWMNDNNLTPYLLVNTEHPETQVPTDYINADSTIILNISPSAIIGLHLGNDRIVFTARFGGKPFQVCVPIPAVKAIYTKENGQGMVFDEEENPPTTPPSDTTPPTPAKPPTKKSAKKPMLKVVK